MAEHWIARFADRDQDITEGVLMRKLLKNRNARRYLLGQSFSLFGDTAMFLALGIWVKVLTGSNGDAGLVLSSNLRHDPLRECNKIKLRRSIQAQALRLFAQGYEHTTVEQIAEAAETSTTTFYCHFPTREDVVLDDEYDPLIDAVTTNRPRDEPLVTTIRAITAALAAFCWPLNCTSFERTTEEPTTVCIGTPATNQRTHLHARLCGRRRVEFGEYPCRSADLEQRLEAPGDHE